MPQHPGEMNLEERKLFGGYAKINAPINFKDVSDFRQVPDHQEVFVASDSDATLIIEILESPDNLESGSDSRLKLHWIDICQANSSDSNSIESFIPVKTSSEEIDKFMVGFQNIPKFNKQEDTSKVKIFLFCMHIPNFNTDILISVSVPKTCSENFTNSVFEEIIKSFQVTDWELFQ